jgi:hypothetical protein
MLVRQGRSIFQNPGKFAGSIYGDSGNFVKGGLRNRAAGGFEEIFSAYPSGHLPGSAFVPPQKDGAISSYTLAFEVITQDTIELIPARNLELTPTTLTIVVSNAQLDQIVSGTGSSSMAITVTSASLVAAAQATASASIALTVNNALCGAIFSVTANGTLAVSADERTLTAIGHMIAEAGGPTPLSPEGLAAAVWNAILADFNETGSTGAALADAGGSGNPWSALLADNADPGSFGERVQKLLTTTKFMGIK